MADPEQEQVEGSGHCHVCDKDLVPGSPLDCLDHLRLMHPDVYGDGPERWPDGGVVIWEPETEEDQ